MMSSVPKNLFPFSDPTSGPGAPQPKSQLYGAEYYLHHFDPPYSRENKHWLEFFGGIADEIVRTLSPKTVLDVGCAKGFLVEALRDRGVEAFGTDISEHAIGEVREDIRPFCSVASATEPIRGHYDLITCIEVCEHLTEFEARSAIRNMAAHAEAILFSSTPSDMSEPTHVNVRPILYWLRAFRELSFAPDVGFNTNVVAPQAVLFRRSEKSVSDDFLQELATAKTAAVTELSNSTHRENERLQRLLESNSELLKEKEQLRHEIEDFRRQLDAERERSRLLESHLSEREDELAARTATLGAVLNSRGWRLLDQYRQLRNRAAHSEVFGRFVRVLFRKVAGATAADLEYRHWIQCREQPSIRVPEILEAINRFTYRPKISIAMPVYNTAPQLLNAAIESVRAQFYTDWELCICNDGSSAPHIRETLDGWAATDQRIKVIHSPQNEGISSASNRALAMATGEYVGLLDHDDELSPNALYENVKLLQQNPDADMIYSDEDKLDAQGRRVEPFFKPDWSPEYMLACMYTCHFGVYRKSLLDEIGGFRAGYEGSQDYDLVLRFTEKARKILHIPRILYHWRMIPGSAAKSSSAKPYAYSAAKRALSEHIERRGVRGEVMDGQWLGHYWVKFPPDPADKVSIIIPTRDKVRLLRACINSIEKKTTGANYEILVLDNNSTEPETKRYLSGLRHRVVRMAEPFNYSRLINQGVRQVTGKYLLLLNNDVEVISPDWINAMLGFCRQKEIGAVGAKLLYRNDRIQHAGVVLGLGGMAGHPLRYYPRYSSHSFGIACDLRNYSAVTAACMMVRREVFEQVGGFDEELSVAYNDVDFCLRVREAGYRIVWTPYAELYHHESASRGFAMDPREIAHFQKRWGGIVKHDPYYNPNLTLEREDFGLRMSG